MLWATLGARLLENLLTGKGVIRAVEGTIGNISLKIFDVASAFNLFTNIHWGLCLFKR